MIKWEFARRLGGEKMTSPITNLDTCTEEELEQALAYLLAHAPRGVLNDAEVEKFWPIHKEIQPPEESGNKYRLQGSYS